MTVSFRSVKSQGSLLLIAMSLLGGLALADQTGAPMMDQSVYKCGQEITNQPNDPRQCQKLLISSPTQIEGTRVQTGLSSKPAMTVTDAPVERSSNTPSMAQDVHQRNAHARTTLEDEWQKLSTRHAEMVRSFNGGQPALQPGESLQSTPYKRRTAEMQTQIDRLSRDLMALKRELTRHTSNVASVQTK